MKRVLVLQVRADEEIAEKDFIAYNELNRSENVQLIRFNLLFSEFDAVQAYQEYDGFILGGSNIGPGESFQGREELFKFLEIMRLGDKPFLGICFGFQMLMMSFGAHFRYDPSHEEFCTKTVHLTSKAVNDPVFEGVEKSFEVQLGHNWVLDRGVNFLDLLVLGEFPNHEQGFKFPNKNIYGFLFHPELNKEKLHERFNDYNRKKEQGIDLGYSFDESYFSKFKASPLAGKIVSNFLEKIV